MKATESRWQLRFFSLWLTQALSQIGSQITQFALIWWITQTVGSATALATAAIMGLLPQVLIGPFAGVLVDRWNRKRIMIAADLVSMACVLVVAVLFATGQPQLWQLYAMMFIRSVCGAFQFPAMQATTPLIVPEVQLARVAGLNQMLQGATMIAAPVLSALLMTLLPLQAMLLIDVVTALPAVAVLIIFVIPQATLATAQSGPVGSVNLWHDLREGLRFMLGFRALLIICVIGMVVNFLITPTVSFMPLLITQHFKGQVTDLAIAEAAFGIAFVVGGLLLGLWGGFKRRIVTSAIGLAGLGLGTFLVGLAPSNTLWLAWVGIFIMGFMNTFANGALMAIMQKVVPNQMQGRVMSLLISATALMTPVSLILAGPISDQLGLQMWYIVGGIICALMSLVIFASPAVMRIEERSLEPQGAGVPSVKVEPMAKPAPANS